MLNYQLSIGYGEQSGYLSRQQWRPGMTTQTEIVYKSYVTQRTKMEKIAIVHSLFREGPRRMSYASFENVERSKWRPERQESYGRESVVDFSSIISESLDVDHAPQLVSHCLIVLD